MGDTTLDEIEFCQNVEPHEEDNSIKSKAVVKLSTVQVPARFARLECNTDLNLPPSNWLSNAANTYGLRQAIYHSSGFASFRMANMFPDCLGEVDVVSDAENIKNLLKLPYSPKNAISMMVHRIENTLLIDEFDIQKYLLRQADDDWKWLRTFICEHILSNLSEKDRNFCLKDKSRGTLQRKNLLSKFLYHSLQQPKETQSAPESETSSKQTENQKTLPLTGPVLPEPNVDENVPDPQSNHVFNRNVVWTFEDIRMLIGTDMPIFGGGTRPCISLRLRDMTKPINVLTGIDYWLDNLMCNVPEVVMCYHLDGIVQKYELVKTEDLPYLENSKFSPQLIRNVAQNILAFLKANATKAGHTYWLFKGKNDDVVKLYDLTTLCRTEDCENTKNENPFTVPVGMLLYTVARNMKNTTENISAKRAGSIRTLLVNCIKLLPKEKYPKIVTSSHYILSDLYVPAGTDPKAPNFDVGKLDGKCADDDVDDLFDCEMDEDEDETSDTDDNVAIKNICDTLKEFKLEENWKNNRLPQPLVGLVEERCKIALQHVYDGLECLKYFASGEEELLKEKEEFDREEKKRKIIQEEQNPNIAKPFQPIPLPYESLKEPKMTNPDVPIPLGWDGESKSEKKKNKGKKNKHKEASPKKTRRNSGSSASETEKQKLIVNETSTLFKSWNVHLKLLLLEKGCLCYATLSEYNYTQENYGKCLQNIYMALRCQQIIVNYMSTVKSQKGCLLGRAGDCFFNLSKNLDNIEEFLKQYKDYDDIDNSILDELDKDFKKCDAVIELPEPSLNVEDLMLKSCQCYERALLCVEDQSRSNLIQRLGSVRNELGIKYMNWAQDEYAKYIETLDVTENEAQRDFPENELKLKEPLYQSLSKLSYDSLIKGITAFQEVNDNINLAFLYCNMGRFFRFRAHIHFIGEKVNCLLVQKKYYTEAFSSYERALTTLGSKKNHSDLWDLINWELSTAIFTYAKQLQDYGQSFDVSENEIADMLQKSLKLCDVEVSNSRQILYKFRSGLVHHRLASLHHNSFRNTTDEIKKKVTLQLSKLHYEKAAKIFTDLREPKAFLETQLERVGLEEYLGDASTGTKKIKHLEAALEYCLNSQMILDHFVEAGLESSTSEEMLKLMKLFKSRLQHILKTLAKINSAKSPGKDSNVSMPVYKFMYSCTLKIRETEDPIELARNVKDVLKELSQSK